MGRNDRPTCGASDFGFHPVTSRPSGETPFSTPARLVIGLTGPIAAGKSTVAALLQERGADVIDADRAYHRLIAPGAPLWQAIVSRFGPGIVSASGEIDRKILGKIVFGDSQSLAGLDRLSHPAVAAEIRRQIAESDAEVVVVEAVKLIESGLAEAMDVVWLVTATPEARIARLRTERAMSGEEASTRVAATENVVPEGWRPDATIDTSGTLAGTRRAVDEAWQKVRGIVATVATS